MVTIPNGWDAIDPGPEQSYAPPDALKPERSGREPVPVYGVYRVLASGAHEYVSRSATTNQKLAMEIASDLSIGRIVRPDGRELWVPAHPHIHKPIGGGESPIKS